MKMFSTAVYIGISVGFARFLANVFIFILSSFWDEISMLQLLDLPTILVYRLAESLGYGSRISPTVDLLFWCVSSVVWSILGLALAFLILLAISRCRQMRRRNDPKIRPESRDAKAAVKHSNRSANA
jgi:hypothetical protein